jgi:uncharacterized membrane protein YqjE
MVDQTTTRIRGGNGPAPKPAEAMTRNIAGFGHDIVALTELQLELLGVDLRESVGKTIVPTGLLLFAGMLALGCFPVALIAMSYLLIGWGLPFAGAFGLSALVGLIVAGIVLYVGVRRFQHSLDALQRSRDEFSRNLTWIKNVLKQSRRTWREHE